MINELKDLWDRALADIEKEMLKPSAETWLKSARPLALYEDTVVIGLPNEFVRDWVESRYSAPIRKSLSRLTSRPMVVRFVVPQESQAPPSGQPQAPSPAYFGGNGNGYSSSHSTGSNGYASNGNGVSRLNPKYMFESFVVGQSNRFAHAAALAVSGSPAKAYNPLFIYGGVGLGKTHLMHAIGHRVIENSTAQRVCYVSTETFTNELIAAIRDGKTMEFRARYRNVDVLLLDDVQFLAGKEGTQEELFHTFDALHQASKQIVISSDRPPREIATLEGRLRTRFEWGLISDIQSPDTETRMAILRKKARADNLDVPDDVSSYIAQYITSNIRELEGALVRVAAYASLTKRSIDIYLAQEALRDILPDTRHQRTITIDHIQKIVAGFYSLDASLFKDKKRTRAVAFPRQIAMYLSRELTDSSLPKIGEEFGGRDHTTVLHAIEKISGDIQADSSLAGTVRQLVTRIRGQ